LRRIWEVDTLRGFAIVLMLFYHTIWDLAFFQLYPFNIYGVGWQTFARFIATLFTFVMGIALTLSYHRANQRADSLFSKYLYRGGQIFGCGMLITVATYFVIGNGFVIFGILHLLGVSTIISYPFLKHKWISLIAGLIFIGIGIYLGGIIDPSPWFIWLGIKQAGRAMVDYYPVFPWSGLALIGIFTGHTLYPQGEPRFILPDLTDILPIRLMRFLGQHSLLIYLIHQPILFSGLWLIMFLFQFTFT
jgi:uncharacterized membrane protein